jgi:hypothetical protein
MALLLCAALAFSQQHDAQTRYNSGFRQFYQWNGVTKTYELKDSEYESSIIDIREINFSNNGYIVIAMTDDAKTRLYHGSITAFNIEGDDEIWSMRSKILRSKLVYNRKKKTITYSFESNDERYMKIFIFTLSDD